MSNRDDFKIHVFVCDEDPFLREALMLFLLEKMLGERKIEVTEVDSPSSLLFFLGQGGGRILFDVLPDLILLGIDEPSRGESRNTDLIATVHQLVPQAEIVVLSWFKEKSLVREAIEARVNGFLWKLEMGGAVPLLGAIEMVRKGWFVTTQSIGADPDFPKDALPTGMEPYLLK